MTRRILIDLGEAVAVVTMGEGVLEIIETGEGDGTMIVRTFMREGTLEEFNAQKKSWPTELTLLVPMNEAGDPAASLTISGIENILALNDALMSLFSGRLADLWRIRDDFEIKKRDKLKSQSRMAQEQAAQPAERNPEPQAAELYSEPPPAKAADTATTATTADEADDDLPF